MREVAYFLSRLDSQESMESIGKSILENSLFTISTEFGDGRHSDVKRELAGVFHAINGVHSRFRTGQIINVGAGGIDFYNTILNGMEVDGRLGPADREVRSIDRIRFQ